MLPTAMPNLHRVAEERSLALHRAIATKLRERPELVAEAADRVDDWLERGLMAPTYAHAWRRILAGSIEDVCHAITEDSDDARALRQTTPFVGVVDPRTRWSIWAEVRTRMGA